MPVQIFLGRHKQPLHQRCWLIRNNYAELQVFFPHFWNVLHLHSPVQCGFSSLLLCWLCPDFNQITRDIMSAKLECKPSALSVWIFQVQSGEDSVPRRKAPGVPVNKDTPVRKFGKRENQEGVTKQESERKSPKLKSFTQEGITPCWLCFLYLLAPVVTSPPPPAGEVVKFSSRSTDHVVPSQDIQGIWLQKLKNADVMIHKQVYVTWLSDVVD